VRKIKQDYVNELVGF
jgi:dynein regulatry complex protein 1